ncbi:alkaline shock response membrane anchor protein AmaP [Brevibacterium renqingii]|uniref:alkaline shock response membrane anchor protein AmaP n=1 Tax=Brevibacterium renqingii TaxID=2776916 RepID=UPI001FE45A5F|nr:alkaline shock response membrane anchor protein AmaP [Brevibacterium renqingii]
MSDDAAWETDDHLRGVIDEYMGAFEPDPAETVGLRERILDIVREDLARGPSTRLSTPRGNPFTIATAAVRTIVRDAVDAVDGIRGRSVSLTPAGEPEGTAAEVEVTVAMRAGIAFAPTAEVIRESVAAALIEQLGIPATTIDITVEDVYEAEETEDG